MILDYNFQILGIKTTVGHYIIIFSRNSSWLQRPVTRSFDVYIDLRPNKLLSKQSWGWWFETPSRPFWRHRNVIVTFANTFPCMKMVVFWFKYQWIYNTPALAPNRRPIIICSNDDKVWSYGSISPPALISNYIHYKMGDGITYSFPNSNGATIDVWN